MKHAEIEQEILTIEEVAVLYGKHRRTVDGWIKSNNPPPSFRKSNIRLFERSKLIQWKTPRKEAP